MSSRSRRAGGEGRHPHTSEELERQLRERLDALGPAPRAELLHVLMLPDFDRADRRGIRRSRALHPRAADA